MSNEHRIQILKDKRDLINKVSPSFCTAKWLQTTLYLQNGYNHSCHHPSPHKVSPEELQQNSLALINSKYKKEQRAYMLEGKRPDECDYCWKIEDLNKDYFSDRHYKTSDYWAWDRFEEIANSDPNADVYPSYLEVSFSNVCNFKCAYCSPEISSKWIEEVKKFGPYPTSMRQGNFDWLKEVGRYPYAHNDDNPYLDAFWKIFPSALEHLKVFRITGGEPLLSKDFWRVIDQLIEYPRAIEIAINSNLCVEKQFIERLVEKVKLLRKTHSVKIYTSLESTGVQAEYVRYGLNFTEWCDNVDFVLANTDSEVTVNIMTTVNILSITTFSEFIECIMEFRKKFNTDFSFNRIPLSVNFLRWPPFLSMTMLPQNLKDQYGQKILSTAEKWLKYHSTEKYARLYLEEYDQVKRLVDYLNSTTDNHRADFVAFIREYDKRKNLDFETVFPEYANMIKEWENA